MTSDDRLMKSFSHILSLLPEDLPESEKAEAQRIRGNLKNLVGVEEDPKKEAERQEHKKALAEVHYIIHNLDADAAARIPTSFKKFLEDGKWENYTPKNLSHLRDETYSLLDIAYRHFLSAEEDRPRLQLKYYAEVCLHALNTATRLSAADVNGYAQQIQNAATTEELIEAANACGIEKHLRFVMEKEEKITLLFS